MPLHFKPDKYAPTCPRAMTLCFQDIFRASFESFIYFHTIRSFDLRIQRPKCLISSMTDLTAVLPGFPTQQYIRLLPSLEKNLVTTVDLVTLDVAEIAKRSQLPPVDLKRLCNAVLEALYVSLGVDDSQAQGNASLKTGNDTVNSWSTISTLDDELDLALGGGIPTGYITEVTGERCIPSHPTVPGKSLTRF